MSFADIEGASRRGKDDKNGGILWKTEGASR
jgi:hypothetical protein